MDQGLDTANDVVRRMKSMHPSWSSNPLAELHFGMCKAVGSYVPLEEFLDMPLSVPFELMSIESKLQKDAMKGMKLPNK